jgi:gliding motility-associated-like protein
MTALGFVADYGKDGWTTGSPAYFGDYFMPGAVQEGFSVQVNGVRANAWSNNYQSTGPGFTGPLTGTNISLQPTATETRAVWQGMMSTTLLVRQTIILKKTKSYFVSNVVLKNTGTDTLKKIYYQRTVDPDNEVSISGNYTTTNKIAYQLPNPYNKTLVTATGTTYRNAYLGLGTKDCQAKCFVVGSGLFATADLESAYNGTSGYYYVDSTIADVGIGLVFKIGTLAPGDSTSFSYAYILNEADLDDAFMETEPGFSYNGTFYPSGSVIVKPTGTVVPIDIVNGDYYNWNWAPPSFLDVTTGTHVNDTVSTGPITYTITGIGNGVVASRCSNRSLSITVSPYMVSPPPSVISPVLYCINQTPSPLFASGLGTIKWYTTLTGGVGVTTPPIPATTAPGSTTWYATQTINGLESVRMPVTVIVRTPTSISISPSNPAVCFGDSVRLVASVGAGATAYYTWSPSGSLVSNNVGDTVKAFPTVNTTYTILATDNANCKSNTTVSVVVKPLPTISASAATGAICSGDATQLTAIGSSLSYTWDATPSLNTLTGPVVIAKPIVSTTYFVTGTDNNNCKKKVSVLVIVNPLPVPNLGPDKSICTDAIVPITPGNFTKYTWQDNSTLPSFDVVKIGTYWVKVENVYGCKAADTINILSLFVLPKDFMPNDTSFCKGNLITIKVPGYKEYLWSDGSAKSSNILKQFGTFRLTVKDVNGCYGNDSIRLFDAHCIPFAVPNAFTPNQDGKNDVFRPFITQIVTGYKMNIYSRWGEMVFETDVPQKGWDGMYKGYLQPPGTYVYVIQFNDSDGVPVQLKGTLNLIK